MTKYAGADWLQDSANRTLSPLGKEVADILGQVFSGIYHIDTAVLSKKVDWSNKAYIELSIRDELATFDFGLLTKLVLCCHARKIRLSISGANYRYLKLLFLKSPNHPSIEDSIAKYSGDILALSELTIEKEAIANV